MQQERYVSATKIYVCAMWTTVASLTLATWILSLAGADYCRWAAVLGFTAATLSSVAAVVHIRAYTLRVTQLIRIIGRLPLEGPPNDHEGVSLHSVH